MKFAELPIYAPEEVNETKPDYVSIAIPKLEINLIDV